MEEDYKIIDHYLMIRLPEEIDHHSCSVICRRADHMMLDNSVSHIVFDFPTQNLWTAPASAYWRGVTARFPVLEARCM